MGRPANLSVWQTSPSIPLVSPRVTPAAPIGSPLCTLFCRPGVVYGLVCPEDRSILACDLHDTEAVVVGIFQHDKIFLRTVSPRIPGRPDLDQPLHFALLIVGVEIQVQSARFSDALERFRNLLQRHVGSSAPGITKYCPAVINRLHRNVMERFLPERHHSVELVTTYNDRTDFHCSSLTYGRHPNQVERVLGVTLRAPEPARRGNFAVERRRHFQRHLSGRK